MEEYYCRKCGMVVGSEYHFCSICGTSTFVRRGKNEEMQILGTINYPTCEFCGVNFINQIGEGGAQLQEGFGNSYAVL